MVTNFNRLGQVLTDLVGEHLWWQALSFGTRCQLLCKPPAPTRRTVSNEH